MPEMPRRHRRRRRRSIPTVDRISTLPDSVLYLILSFLPTKDAVATSLLSKRWNPLWLSLPNLDFDDEAFPIFHRFRHFVYSVIHSRDTALPIRSFRLKFTNSSLSLGEHHNVNRDIRRFVYAAVQRGVEHLNLDISRPKRRVEHLNLVKPCPINFQRVTLPPCILDCTTLSFLQLKEVTVDDLPHVDLPSLKTLHLDCVNFKSHGYLMKFLHGCPILEDLQTKHLVLPVLPEDHTQGDVRSLPNLVRAKISNFTNLHIPFTLLENAEFLRVELNSTDYSALPMFNNLTHMELIFMSNMWHGELLRGVLQRCPKLQNLTIHRCWTYIDGICDYDWEGPRCVPECLSSQLRTCSLVKCKGMKCELQFAKYILQHSKVLRTMKIDSYLVDINEKLQMISKLCLFPRGSSACRLLFNYRS